MSILKQNVTLEVYDKAVGGNLVLKSDKLRVDFDIRHISEFSRGKFTIYNLNNKTITKLMDGDRFVTLKTSLHGGKEYTLANRFAINNAVDELKLPDRITTLYGYDRLRLKLEEQVNETVKTPNLKRMVEQVLRKAGHTGGIEFKYFPKGVIEDAGYRNIRTMQGSVQSCLRVLEKEYGFDTFTYSGNIILNYLPHLNNVRFTELYTKESEFTLDTKAMRSNPKIGVARAIIDSNLEPRIGPTTVLDLSNLLTIGVEASDAELSLGKDYLKNFSAYTKYVATFIEHKGSNYTSEWNTKITALSPKLGAAMPTVGWMNKTTKG